MTVATLGDRLPSDGNTLADEAILSHFVENLAENGLTPYPHQEEAILELLGGKHVVLSTPTGSGKSLVATALHFMTLARQQRTFYTCPVKALVNEKFFALCDSFGAARVGMMTGDASINPQAPIVCCTAEVLAALAIRETGDFAQSVVMDEFHYYGDRDRGVAWQIPLLMLPRTQFLLMSATLGDVSSIITSLKEVTERDVVEVRSVKRPVPLEMSYAETPLHETVEGMLRTGKSPIYLVNFSQRAAAEQAQNLTSTEICTKLEKQHLREAMQGFGWPTPFGKDLKRLLAHGVGIHHAGMLPRYRRIVERLSQRGLLKVVSGTDTLGVGVNIPIRTVLFTQLCKFDGEKTVLLPVRDFMQIAGRAGRKGFDDRGWVVAQAPPHVIENARLTQKRERGKRNVHFLKPPTRGYVHWDKATFNRLCNSPPEKLESSFTVTHGLLIGLLQAGRGYRTLVALILLSHTYPQRKRALLVRARTLCRALLGAGVLVYTRRKGATPAAISVSTELQEDFSLHHTLSLYLLDALPRLELASEAYDLDVLSLVEAILENPEPVLRAQVDQLKTAKMQELKAQGVEFERRIAELDKVTHPKANADFIYATFDAFAAKHPWLEEEAIRPKSVARDVYTTGATFNEFIRDYRLQRCEGIVLRYLSEVYKALNQNIPDALKTEGVEELTEHIFTLVKLTDSSLLDEWESMRAGVVVAPQLTAPVGRQPRRILDAGPKALRARLRAEMHQVVRHMAKHAWQELAEALAQEQAWPSEVLESTMAPYFATYGELDLSARARQPNLTVIDERDAKVWRVRHTLRDPKGESDWFIEGIVNLMRDPREPGPLIQVRHIGP